MSISGTIINKKIEWQLIKEEPFKFKAFKQQARKLLIKNSPGMLEAMQVYIEKTKFGFTPNCLIKIKEKSCNGNVSKR